MRLFKLSLLALIALGQQTILWAADTTAVASPEVLPESQQRDQHLASQIRQGSAKWLNDGTAEFLTLHCPSLVAAKGSLLWLTGPNQTVLTPGAISEACDYLPTVGWQVLTVSPGQLDFRPPQMVAAPGATDSDTDKAEGLVIADREQWYAEQTKSNLENLIKRLAPAQQELLSVNAGYILVATGSSASIAVAAINNQQLQPAAVVLLNIAHPKDPQQTQLIQQLSQLTIPALDIYHVKSREQAQQRARIIQQDSYKQLMIPAMRDDFQGQERLVLRRIEDWAEKQKK